MKEYLEVVKEVCKAVGADWKTATSLTIEADGTVHVSHHDLVDGEAYEWTDSHNRYAARAKQERKNRAVSLTSEYDGLQRTVGVSVTVDKDKSTAEVGREIKRALDEYMRIHGGGVA